MGAAMRNVVRTSVRFALFPVLGPIRLVLKLRAQRSVRFESSSQESDTESAPDSSRSRRITRRLQNGSLFTPLTLDVDPPHRASSARHELRDAAAGGADEQLQIASASALIIKSHGALACRPAPTLNEVADGEESVALRWSVGPLRFDGFGFAKARGELSEDAFASNLRTGSVAVADGASSSWQAGEWALELGRAWVAMNGGWDANEHDARIDEVRGSFHRPRDADESADSAGSAPAQWFADEVARRGAFAAFLGVAFSRVRRHSASYRALSVGDVCLLHYRRDVLFASFPVTAASELGSHPELIASSAGSRSSVPSTFEGELKRDDVLVLVTDGVAAYLLHEGTVANKVNALLHGGADQIREELQTARARGDMPDDDYTLVRVAF